MNTDSIVKMNTELIEKARLIAKMLTDDAAAIDAALPELTLFDMYFNGESKEDCVTVEIDEPIKTSIKIPRSALVGAMGGSSGMRQTLLGWIKKYAEVITFAYPEESQLSYRDLEGMVHQVRHHILWASGQTQQRIEWLVNGYESKYAMSCLVGSSVKGVILAGGLAANINIPTDVVFHHFDAEIKCREDDLLKHITRYEFLCSSASA